MEVTMKHSAQVHALSEALMEHWYFVRGDLEHDTSSFVPSPPSLPQTCTWVIDLPVPAISQTEVNNSAT